MSGTDTDSSSESEINQFKEAVDTEFLRDEFYNPEKKSSKHNQNLVPCKY